MPRLGSLLCTPGLPAGGFSLSGWPLPVPFPVVDGGEPSRAAPFVGQGATGYPHFYRALAGDGMALRGWSKEVPETGLEPVRVLPRRILNPPKMPKLRIGCR